MPNRAFITGISGLELTAAERDFIRAERPWGFILFKRNVDTPAQVARLVAELRATVGEARAPVLIDQEGGRVQRLGPPHWPAYPPGAVFGSLYDRDPPLGLKAARLSNRLIAADLGEKGVFYRATVGPFGSRDEAVQVCTSLKAAGGQCVIQGN